MKVMRKAVIAILSRVRGNVNANEVEGERIKIKKFVTADGEIFPFVSARAIKRAIRNTLEDADFKVDPFRTEDREAGRLADSGDPIKYVDNDLFGYLYIKGQKQVPRPSPIYFSPLIAIKNTPIEIDFGGRFPHKQDKDPVPVSYTHLTLPTTERV